MSMLLDAPAAPRPSSGRGILAAAAVVLLVVGGARAESADQFAGYVMILAASAIPAVLWVRDGARGIPVFPVVALAHSLYYAWPVLSGNESTRFYADAELLRGAMTVTAFLAVATAAWYAFLRLGERPRAARMEPLGDRKRIARFLFAGLAVAIVFHVGVAYGVLASLGSLFGAVRSFAVTFGMVSCFLIGISKARGTLTPKQWTLSLAGVAVLVALNISSLFLIGGVMYTAAVFTGYVMVSRRPPWKALAAVCAVVAVLHAGKAEMRERHWQADANYGGVVSVFQLPALLVSWVTAGAGALFAGEVSTGAFDRASLLQMVLLAQSQTPEYIDYLGGETYAMVPSVLVPRFIDADKPASQVGMDLLNITYGLLTIEGAATTAIGWGLIAEAFANFGMPGVALVALALGIVSGSLGRWTNHAPVMSTPALLSIAVLVSLLNLEADSVALLTTLLQSTVSALAFGMLFNWLVRPGR